MLLSAYISPFSCRDDIAGIYKIAYIQFLHSVRIRKWHTDSEIETRAQIQEYKRLRHKMVLKNPLALVLFLLILLLACGGGSSGGKGPGAKNKPPSPTPLPSAGAFQKPRGIYILDSDKGTFNDANIRELPFVTGYVLRMSWADFETTEGVYDFSAIDHIIAKLDSIGQKLTLFLGGTGTAEPGYIAATPGVRTWIDRDSKTGTSVVRAVPWDPFLLDRFRAFTKALGDHLVPSAAAGGHLTPLRDHPVLANINFGVAGLGEIRDRSVKIADIPGYTRQNLTDAVNQSLHAQVDEFPNKFVAVGLWNVTDSTQSPVLWQDISVTILNEFDGIKNPRVGFFEDNLAASKDLNTGAVTGYPSTDFAPPLFFSKNVTFIMFQALQSWVSNTGKTANATPADGIEYGYNTYGCTYFELYVADIDNQNNWPSFQKLHDFLMTAQ